MSQQIKNIFNHIIYMKTRILAALALATLAVGSAGAQAAVDAYTLTPTQLRGTARFISMGGAFTSLGGDLSCMTQNPAGLGLYRQSDIGLTFDVSMRRSESLTNCGKYTENKTKAFFDNFGYVGVAKLNGAMSHFQWGVSYNRLNVFDRITVGENQPIDNSLSNYIASYTNGVVPDDLLEGDDYDPYYNPDNDWLSVLAYNSFMINGAGSDKYRGLYNDYTKDDSSKYHYREFGYTDEYNIDFAGNVSDMIFWGVGLGIVDMQYTRYGSYSESMAKADVYYKAEDMVTQGTANFDLTNDCYVNGNGVNLKVGVVVRPIEALRLGLAVHTPTWYHLSHSGYGKVVYEYKPDADKSQTPTNAGYYTTPDYEYTSRLNSPWRLMLGASTVIGSKAIVSLDYERVAYNDMKMKEQSRQWYGSAYVDNTYANEDIKNYFRAANIVRFGIEYRITRQLSARAGYNFQTSAVKSEAMDGKEVIYTSGTDPSYTFNKDTHNLGLGLGFRLGMWYIDLAYQYTHQTSTFKPYTNFDNYPTPSAAVTHNHNNVVISTGLRF